MADLIYRRGERTVTVAEEKTGTRRVLEQSGFRLVPSEIEPIPDEAWALGALNEDVWLALAAQFDSPDEIRAASDAQILAIHGIGPATLQKIREALG